MPTFTLREVRAVCKERDAWWTVLLVDPVAVRLTRSLASRTAVTPGQITLAAFALGLGAAGCFVQGTPGWLALGALLYHVGFVLDCCDGKLARLKGLKSPFGAWLDYMLDRVRDGACALALAYGLYTVTGQAVYWAMGCAILALDMFRYLNSAQLAKARRSIRRAAVLNQRALTAMPPGPDAPHVPSGAGVPRQRPEPDLESTRPMPPGPSPRRRRRGGGRLRGAYTRVRSFLLRRRIRMHLVSGIEFQMAAFIVGPLTGLALQAVAVAGGLLLLFEVALIVKFWRRARRSASAPLAACAPAPAPAV
ncbi:CDP-alcohol phosphatidyltransferase family protein [Actinomadura rugatobispora]|uniref:CDP-alcohol phosphatidyltransferase family protein n=1 Tax=Actinomadura rugatobispora TaxID=1994 RepID=A0ABW1A611_9ACTN